MCIRDSYYLFTINLTGLYLTPSPSRVTMYKPFDDAILSSVTAALLAPFGALMNIVFTYLAVATSVTFNTNGCAASLLYPTTNLPVVGFG